MTASTDTSSPAFAAILAVARDYLDGMVYADEAQLRRAFHPQCMMVGHYRGRLEFDPIGDFIVAVMKAGGPKRGTPYYNEIVSIDITGDMAVVKLTDDYLGERFTDYLTLLQHEGNWLIVNKVFYVHGDA